MSEVTEQQRWEILQLRIKEAHAVLNSNPNYNLDFRPVMRVLAVFGSHLDRAAISLGEQQWISEPALLGWQRRAWNSILCAEKTLPFWTENPLVESNILEVLAEARLIVQSSASSHDRLLLPLMPSSENFSYKFPYAQKDNSIRCALFAYFNVEYCVHTVNWDVEQEFEIDSYYDYLMLGDYWTIPNVISTALLFGGGRNYPHEHDQARREFWLWWLDKAVPASWNLEEI